MSATSPAPRQGGYADTVASNVRAEAARRQISQSDICRMTGMKTSTLGRKWHGHYPFDVDDLERIAAALKVPLATLTEQRYRSPTDEKFGDKPRRAA